MIENLPAYISIIFGLTTILSVILFYYAANRSKITLTVLLIWLTIQTFAGLSGFLTITDTFPPRLFLLLLPAILFIIVLFTTVQGKRFIDSLNVRSLTILHTVRIPVEIVLYWLYLNKAAPELMTFTGRNFDILAGLTAPFIFYFGFIKKRLSNNFILLWNIICLALLLNIVINAVLAAPFPIQQFAFEQPNIAVLYFPFNWLPTCVVPLVLLSHLAAIRQMFAAKKMK